ncbi:hypothetical protein GQ55_1G251700 [Panicum hallii var. hallii]|uniref:GIR1-like zinc ribbon domain-containing protein n=2 Tax=Panicum hallii TaxID=206008 RepID=A0A2T7F7B5_9POAL|nr:uncharacterized protein LOC112884423 [Panicum hallii]PAN06336.1 hypothetical protein PAHAL_1G256700 [Panicum hallii]PUZ75956.1 hypothetical protein GQ55_1G251700 [Panicum hallii var. hallii]
MSRGGLDLKLHLSPPAPARGGAERRASPLSSSDEEWSSSSPSSCLSSEGEREPQPHRLQGHGLQWSDSPEATSMVLAACPRCLMYVMLSEADPRCPRCRSPVLLDFLHHAAGAARASASGGREGDGHSRNGARGGGGGRRNRRA